MAKERTAHAYELELRKMIKSRTGADMELWLLPQVRATAANMVILDKIQTEILDSDSLIVPVLGSQGQLEALGLNYSTTPSKVKEDTRKGVSENDTLTNTIAATREEMNNPDGFIIPE